MRVCLASVLPEERHSLFRDQFRKLATISAEKRHTLTSDPEAADAILLLDLDDRSAAQDGRANALLRKYPGKCFVYNESDTPIFLLPGVYASCKPTLLSRGRTRSYTYVSRHTYLGNEFVGGGAEPVAKDLFFSFVGAPTSFVRKRLFKCDFKRSDILLENTVGYQHWNLKGQDRPQMQRRYVEVAKRSRFGLCLRGAGVGSIRLFEMMEMGVAPVIVSDRWIPSAGPDWREFAVFVKERQICKLPLILEEYDADAAEMGRKARLAWERFFAPDKQFDYILDRCGDIARNRHIDERLVRLCWPAALLAHWTGETARRWARRAVIGVFRLAGVRFPYALNR